MSRSFKKKPYHSICKSRGDKWCRSQYHRERRQKDKRLCKEMEGTIDKEVLYYNNCFLCTKNGLQPEEKFISENIDRSLRYADKYCWQSDGGNYYWGGKDDFRRDFEKEVFGINKYNVEDTPWKKYQIGIGCVFNDEKPEYTIKLQRQVPKKIDFGFYMPWNMIEEVGYETETTYIHTKEYPPKAELPEDWIMTNWWRHKSYQFRKSNWDLFGFLFKNSIIPLDLKNESELIDWLRANEELIIEKWLKAQLLRK